MKTIRTVKVDGEEFFVDYTAHLEKDLQEKIKTVAEQQDLNNEEYTYPTFNSYVQFDRWVDKLIKGSLGTYSSKLAEVILRVHKDKDHEFVLECDERKINEVSTTSPFGLFQDEDKVVKYLTSNLDTEEWSYASFVELAEWTDKSGITSHWIASYLNRLKEHLRDLNVRIKLEEKVAEYEGDFNQLSLGEVYEFAVGIRPTEEQIKFFELTYPVNNERAMAFGYFGKEIDMAFFPTDDVGHSGYTLEQLHRSGVSINTLLNNLPIAKGFFGPDVTTKERVEIYEANKKLGYRISPTKICYSFIATLIERSHLAANKADSDYDWIYRYAKDSLSVRWAIRNAHHLSKVREMNIGRGETICVYAHRMLEYVDAKMLNNNPRTGWKKISALVDEKMREELEAQLGDDRPLPKLPDLVANAPEFKGIRQIDTTHGLGREGKIMAHCVAQYVRHCDSGKCFILHVEDGSDLGATVEINPPTYSERNWYVNQCMNFNNKPSAKAKEIVLEFVKYLPVE